AAAQASPICGKTSSLRLLFRGFQDEPDCARQRLPLRLFARKLFASRVGEAIVSGALALVGEIPGSRNPSLRFQAVQGGIERTRIQLQEIFGSPLDVFRDRVTVPRAAQKRLENQQVKRALEKFYTGRGCRTHCVEILYNIP